MDSFTVSSTKAILIGASTTDQVKINNGSGGTIYYKNASDVDTGDTAVVVGASATLEETVWIISASASDVYVEHLTGATVQDETVSDVLKAKTLTVTGAGTVGTTLGVTGITTPTGGVATISGVVPGVYGGNWVPYKADAGSDTTPGDKKLFLTSVFLPANKTITGIGFQVGSVGGTNKVVLGLFKADGTFLKGTTQATEGTLVGTAKEIQEIDLTATYAAVGPALYYVGLVMNGNTARFYSIPVNTAGKNIYTGEKTLASTNTMATFTTPPTTFTAALGPVCWVY